jgi:predicted deacylase
MNLQRYVVGGRRAGPRLLITAGVHGDEFEPMVAVRRLAEELSGPVINGTVTLIPIVNEPAYLLGTRMAEDGLDLARTCPGNPRGTVTERVAAALSDAIRSSDYYIDLHTGGSCLRLSPLAGYMLHADERVLDEQRSMARAFNLPIVWGTSPELEGRSLSVARDAGIPAIYAEHGGGGSLERRVIEDYRSGCLNVMRLLSMIELPAPPSRLVHQVEDRRLGSGYLQVRHPAPFDGVFMPDVVVGQPIRQGEVLGTLLDPSSGRSVEIQAECSGIALMLHVAPRVKLGTGLAVILEIVTPP